LGLKNIRQVADPAFLLQPSQVAMPEENQGGKMLIGFNVSPLLGGYLGEDGNSVVVRESIRFIEEAVKQYQATILLIPHVVDVGSANNDHEFMKKIYEGTRHTGQVKLLEPDYSANELKFIISGCDYFIGARTHATIAALSSKIPTICIGYSQKAVGINMDLFQTLDYLIDIKSYSSAALLKKFALLREREQEIKKSLEMALPQIRALSWANVDYLREVLC
jgi:polysaccharide pyruvyl transferase WcaK-like protein